VLALTPCSATGSGGGGARASGARTVGGVPLASLLSDFGGGGDGGGAGGGACVDGEDQPRQADAVTARFQEVRSGVKGLEALGFVVEGLRLRPL
jgi:hypothetical protein